MKSKILLTAAATLLISSFISCGNKDVKERRTSGHKIENRVSDTAISVTSSENRTMDDRAFKVGNATRNYNVEESENDRSLYVLASILFASLFFRLFRLNRLPHRQA